MEQVPRRPQGSPWPFLAFMFGYALVLGLLAFLVIKRLPGHVIAIVAVAYALYWAGVRVSVGMEWREIKENPTARSAMKSFLWVFIVISMADGLGDLFRGRTHDAMRHLSMGATVSAFTIASVYAGFGIGWWIGKRRAGHARGEEATL